MPDPPFASPEFLTAWEDWQEFRRSKRKPHTPVSIKYQFSDFKKWGEEKAIESIKNSIKSGYQGLFEPKTVLKTANGRTLEIYTGEAVR